MMVSGLVPELTMEAARLASLGAGAKIVGQFSFELTRGRSGNHSAREPGHFSAGRRHGRRQQRLRHS
ncbi:MAG: glutamate mutase L [Acutalibacteraceae bacterium]